MGHQPKLGSYGKNWIFGPKTEILGPKKGSHFFPLTMFWPRPKKVVQRKKWQKFNIPFGYLLLTISLTIDKQMIILVKEILTI